MDQIPKRIWIFLGIRHYPKIRIIDQKIRIPPSRFQKTQIPDHESRIWPASSGTIKEDYLNYVHYATNYSDDVVCANIIYSP